MRLDLYYESFMTLSECHLLPSFYFKQWCKEHLFINFKMYNLSLPLRPFVSYLNPSQPQTSSLPGY